MWVSWLEAWVHTLCGYFVGACTLCGYGMWVHTHVGAFTHVSMASECMHTGEGEKILEIDMTCTS